MLRNCSVRIKANHFSEEHHNVGRVGNNSEIAMGITQIILAIILQSGIFYKILIFKRTIQLHLNLVLQHHRHRCQHLTQSLTNQCLNQPLLTSNSWW